MDICDAHFHFNMKSKDPVQDMLYVIRNYHLSAVVLILNQECEFQMFVKNREQLTGRGCRTSSSPYGHSRPCILL